MTERFEKLEQLMGGYFHQDWDIQGASDAEVIAAFRRAEPVNQIEETIAEIDYLLELFIGDPLKIDKILAALGCEYYYQALGLNGQEWLQRVRRLLLFPEAQPPASLSSI